MRRVVCVLAGAIACGPAMGEVVGVDIREDKNVVAPGVRSFNFYVVFDGGVDDDERNELLAVSLADLRVSDFFPDVTIFQEDILGSDVPPTPAAIAMFPEIAADTYVSVGNKLAPSSTTLFLFEITPKTLVGGWSTNSPAGLEGAPVFNSDTGQWETFMLQLSLTNLPAGLGFQSGGGRAPALTWFTDILATGGFQIERRGGEGEPIVVSRQVLLVNIPSPPALALAPIALAAARRRRG